MPALPAMANRRSPVKSVRPYQSVVACPYVRSSYILTVLTVRTRATTHGRTTRQQEGQQWPSRVPTRRQAMDRRTSLGRTGGSREPLNVSHDRPPSARRGRALVERPSTADHSAPRSLSARRRPAALASWTSRRSLATSSGRSRMPSDDAESPRAGARVAPQASPHAERSIEGAQHFHHLWRSTVAAGRK